MRGNGQLEVTRGFLNGYLRSTQLFFNILAIMKRQPREGQKLRSAAYATAVKNAWRAKIPSASACLRA
jgi:hypothetical protein